MLATVEIKLPTLYPKQHAAFFGSERISITEATTKAGKSMGALVWLMHFGINLAPGATLLWLSPIYPQAKVMFERLLRILTRMDHDRETGWDVNRSDLTVRLPGGATVIFKGADKPDSIYGADYSAAVIDEYTRCKEDAFFAVRSTLTATRGPIRLIGNVKGRRNWGFLMARKAEAGEPDMAYHKLTCWDAVDAGVLDREEIEQAKRQLPERVFRQLYLAEAADDDGNPFGVAYIAACVADLSIKHPIAWGVDLAKSVDWTVAIGLDNEGCVSEFRRFQMPWEETTTELGRIVKQSALVDSTGVGDPILERLQRVGSFEGYQFTSKSKQQLMEGLAVAIQQREITFPDGPIRMELEAFEYSYSASGVKYSAPDGMHDDCVCALALAVHCWRNHRGIRLADLIGDDDANDYHDEPADRRAWEIR